MRETTAALTPLGETDSNVAAELQQRLAQALEDSEAVPFSLAEAEPGAYFTAYHYDKDTAQYAVFTGKLDGNTFHFRRRDRGFGVQESGAETEAEREDFAACDPAMDLSDAAPGRWPLMRQIYRPARKELCGHMGLIYKRLGLFAGDGARGGGRDRMGSKISLVLAAGDIQYSQLYTNCRRYGFFLHCFFSPTTRPHKYKRFLWYYVGGDSQVGKIKGLNRIARSGRAYGTMRLI